MLLMSQSATGLTHELRSIHRLRSCSAAGNPDGCSCSVRPAFSGLLCAGELESIPDGRLRKITMVSIQNYHRAPARRRPRMEPRSHHPRILETYPAHGWIHGPHIPPTLKRIEAGRAAVQFERKLKIGHALMRGRGRRGRTTQRRFS